MNQSKKRVRSQTKAMQVPKTEEPSTDQLSILHLNDDCLFQIASMLTISDLLILSKVCQRFNYIANAIFSTRKDWHVDMGFIRKHTLVEVQEIMSRIGSRVVKFLVESLMFNKFSVDFLLKFCPNVKMLELRNINSVRKDSIFETMLQDCKNLTLLNLRDCQLGDENCKVLSECVNLENLNLSSNTIISGRYLHKLRKLKKLDLSFCGNLDASHFNKLMTNVKLEYLNIKDCVKLNTFSMQFLRMYQTELVQLFFGNKYDTFAPFPLANFKNLKLLNITTTRYYDGYNFMDSLSFDKSGLVKLEIYRASVSLTHKEQILNLKNLKELYIVDYNNVDDDFINQLATRANLTYLRCRGFNVSSASILNLIEKSDTIVEIDITGCEHISKKLIYDAIDILKAKQRKTRLTLVIDTQRIKKRILCHTNVWSNSHLFRLKYNSDFLFDSECRSLKWP